MGRSDMGGGGIFYTSFGNYFSILRLLLLLLAGGTLIEYTSDANAADDPRFQIKNLEFAEQGRIAFTALNGDNRDIFVLDFLDISITEIVAGPAAEEAPVFSPDGRLIAFHSNATGRNQIYVVNYDGTDLTQLTNSGGENENPFWSPDGTKLVFQSTRQGNGSEIFIMNADGTKQSALVTNSVGAPKKLNTPRISPRGSELLYSSNIEWPGWDIVLFDLGSKQSRIITQGFGSYIRPSWKPDGSSFAFSYGSAEDIDIWLAEKGKSIPNPLIRRPGRDLDPCWTDDGRALLFVSESAGGKGDFQLYVYDDRPKESTAHRSKDAKDRAAVESAKVSQLMQSELAVRHPSWTPFPTLAQLAKKLKDKAEKDPTSIPAIPKAPAAPNRQTEKQK